MTELVDFLKKSFALLKRKSNQVKVNDNHFEQLSVKKEEKNKKMLDFPGGSDGKKSDCSAGDPGSIPGLGRSLGIENGYPLQFSYLENPMEQPGGGCGGGIGAGDCKELDTTECLTLHMKNRL